jgi:hypothetical protein
MDKMTIYESARVVPKEARKSIGGGWKGRRGDGRT